MNVTFQGRQRDRVKDLSAVRLWALCSFLLAAANLAYAQSTPSTQAPVIQRGDVVHITVVGRTDLSGDFTVQASGSITVPLVGQVQAAGKTTTALASDLSHRFSVVDRDILRVDVALAESQTRNIFVLGAVLHPGPLTFVEPPNVWDAIAAAGGATEDADLSAVEMVPGELRGDRTVKIIDVNAALKGGRLQSLDRLRPGDTVRVPRLTAVGSENLVYVFGAFGTQGTYPIAQTPDLVSAVIRGNPTPDANLRKVEIVRKSGDRVQRFEVNLRKYFGDADPSCNPSLQSGDTIYLPRRTRAGFLTIVGSIAPVVALATSIAALTARR